MVIFVFSNLNLFAINESFSGLNIYSYMAVVDEPFKRRLDDFFGRLLQSGLFDKYIHWVKFMAVTNSRFIPEHVTQKNDLIAFDSISLILRIYVILLSSSMVLFAGEVFLAKHNFTKFKRIFQHKKNSAKNQKNIIC